METKLTKEADKLLAYLYRTYKKRRDSSQTTFPLRFSHAVNLIQANSSHRLLLPALPQETYLLRIKADIRNPLRFTTCLTQLSHPWLPS